MKVVIRDGKVDGQKILRAWESLTGWYWFATEKESKDIYFGFVIGFYPEWGNFSEQELKDLSPKVWEIRKKSIQYINRVVDA